MLVPRIEFLLLLTALTSTSSKLLRCSSNQDRRLSDEAPFNTTNFEVEDVILTNQDPHEQRAKENFRGYEISPRIVGGSSVARGHYPYFARVDKYRFPACGGSLVAPDVVLTAGHCQTDSPQDLTVVINGYHDRARPDKDQHFRRVERVVVHPRYYKEGVYYNDMMLLKLDFPVYIVPFIELNREPGLPRTGEELTVMGLGALVEDGSYPDTLQAVKISAIDFNICNASYASANLGPLLENTMFCAGQRLGLRDSCQGDSGGPIIDWRGVQVGTVSFGLGCGREGYPGVYVRTAAREVEDWLGKALCKLTSTAALDEWCSRPLSDQQQPQPIPTRSPTQRPTLSPTPVPTLPPTHKSSPMPTLRPPRQLTARPSPPPTTRPPTPQTTSNPASTSTEPISTGCQDAPDSVKFQVGVFHGDKDCAWLRMSHSVIQQWSCREGSEAWRICKATCGRCSS